MNPKIKTSKLIVCPECNGRGKKMYYHDSIEYTGYMTEPCKFCGGEGMVIKEKTIEYIKTNNAKQTRE